MHYVTFSKIYFENKCEFNAYGLIVFYTIIETGSPGVNNGVGTAEI